MPYTLNRNKLFKTKHCCCFENSSCVQDFICYNLKRTAQLRGSVKTRYQIKQARLKGIPIGSTISGAHDGSMARKSVSHCRLAWRPISSAAIALNESRDPLRKCWIHGLTEWFYLEPNMFSKNSESSDEYQIGKQHQKHMYTYRCDRMCEWIKLVT